MKHLSAHPHYADGWNRSIIALIAGFYALAIVGAFFPTWEGIALAVALYVVTGSGVTVWYHRFFTHGSFDTRWDWIWKIGALTGLYSGEGPPIFWVGWHTLHHQESDTERDPHSPRHGGFWHAHQLWMMAYTNPERYKRIYLKYTPRWMVRSRFLLMLNHTYRYWHFGLIIALAVSGYAYGGWYYAMSFVGYGYFVRTILVLNATWSVNSLSHMWGGQPFKEYTRDESRNNAFVAAVALGEGWHHNHHVCPTSYRHGIRWWQLDPSAWFIWSLWLVGLATNLKPFKLPPLRREASLP